MMGCVMAMGGRVRISRRQEERLAQPQGYTGDTGITLNTRAALMRCVRAVG